MEVAEPHLTGIEPLGIGFHVRLDDVEHLVAPGFIAGGHHIVEVVPAGTEIMELDGADTIAEPFPQEGGDGFGTTLAQGHVAVAGTFGRSTGKNIDLYADGVASGILLPEIRFELFPPRGIAVVRHVDARTVEPEAYIKRIRTLRAR